MIRTLRVVFAGVLTAMLGVTVWASFQGSLWSAWPALVRLPWFHATLWDAYFGFLTFYLWVFYKETGWVKRTAWFVFIMTGGNIAMSIYMLKELYLCPPSAGPETLLLRRQTP